MPAENFDFAEHMAVGDVYPNVLDYLCLWVEEVLVPIFNNPENMKKYKTVEHFRTMGIKSIINLQTPGNNHHTTISSLTLALVYPGPNKDSFACHVK